MSPVLRIGADNEQGEIAEPRQHRATLEAVSDEAIVRPSATPTQRTAHRLSH
jgi:hypothetical protein